MKYITLEKFMMLNNFTDKKKAKTLFDKIKLNHLTGKFQLYILISKKINTKHLIKTLI